MPDTNVDPDDARLERLRRLRAQTLAELAEIEACAHPFRQQFVDGWRERLKAVDHYIAEALHRQRGRERASAEGRLR